MKQAVMGLERLFLHSAKAVFNCIREFAEDENGVGVIEVVLILVVLIGLVAVFKTQINELLTTIFGSINTMSNDIL